MGFLEKFVAENTTEQELEAILDNVCNAIGGSIGQDCTYFVQQYLPQLIYYIENKEPPTTFCTQLGLCSGARSVPKAAAQALTA